MRNNLSALQGTAAALAQTQGRLSSGKKVNSALDNPTNFFSAQSHLQRASDLGNRVDGMSEGIQTVKAADAGITSITSLIQAAKGLASSALGTTDVVARKSYQDQFNELRKQIDTLATDSGYKGTNLLKGNDLTVQFNEKTDVSALTIKGFDASTATSGLNIAGATKDVASSNSSGAAGAALQTASTTLSAVKASFDSAKAAQDALNAADTAIQAAVANKAPDVTGAAVAEAASKAATAAGNAIGGIDSKAKDLFTAAAKALHDSSLSLAAGTDDSGAAKTAAGATGTGIGTYSVNTDNAIAAVILANTNATAASAPATAAGDTAVGTALTDAATALGASDTEGVRQALYDIGNGDNGAATFKDLAAYTATLGTGTDEGKVATDAAKAAADAGTLVTDSGGGWASSINVGNAAITASSSALDGALSTLRTQSSALASNLSVVTTRQDFTSSMIGALTTGSDSLTLADMNQEGANMLMLQTRQSLSTTALSLSSQAAQSILKLF
jgi:flagellin-like hook-associated protein FlgL